MTDPSTWPRDDRGSPLWGEAPGILVARLPSAKRDWEPIIVTTLRRYVRRGASDGLLHRIAGGRRHFNILNRVWDLDGRALDRVVAELLDAEAVAAPSERRSRDNIGELGIALATAERRIALYQVIVDYAAAGSMLPTVWRLTRYFHTTRGAIDNDLDVLRAQGLISVTLRMGQEGPRRFVSLPNAGATMVPPR